MTNPAERQTFLGHIFTRYPGAKAQSDRLYFKRKARIKGNCKKELLHRVVWEFHNGPIQCDCIIHHINRDTANNDISNLVCIKEYLHDPSGRKPLTLVLNLPQISEQIK